MNRWHVNLEFDYEGKAYLLEEMERAFLFPYLLRFALSNDVDLEDEGRIELAGSLVDSLKSYLEQALSELLKDSYQAPSGRHRQKHYTQYQKFEFRDRRYTVNYTTSPIGRLMYLLALRVRLLDEGRTVAIVPTDSD